MICPFSSRLACIVREIQMMLPSFLLFCASYPFMKPCSSINLYKFSAIFRIHMVLTVHVGYAGHQSLLGVRIPNIFAHGRDVDMMIFRLALSGRCPPGRFQKILRYFSSLLRFPVSPHPPPPGFCGSAWEYSRRFPDYPSQPRGAI